ncbi:MAG: CfrBI family restriction endonuclease [Synergistales bacterium]|nr:CfrBI family restriction endonuclease [Synergistales bacterium]MDY6400784.1 CfrBI family restriction endonuclease [Synergistales bacterium]MDY6403972.1 CfrBI family restriction endonuclease [Synergistales bacterium]MDY6410439.1 CfrBI family restriction endonuclease [Synergistales bacterium]MDY6414577.1 CfrBI family restriction endonuclease [Synergistales bacterium]
MTFEDEAIKNTVSKLISGKDYRDEVINSINTIFFDFSINFFKQIVDAKMNNREINMDWYKEYFMNPNNFTSDEIAIFAGLNKKNITNIYGTSSREIVLTAVNNNFEYLRSLLNELENDADSGLAITITISYNDITVKLSLIESLLVINALATKKIQIRGGAWSSIGKKVEKPLLDELCRMANVPAENIDNKTFKKNKNLAYDREVDYKLISRTGKIYRTEVKLMGKGNPESADATIARDSDIFIADRLSEQNCAQLSSRNIHYLVLKNNENSINNFVKILDDLDIPHKEKEKI